MKIAILTSGIMPVPAVLGGAVETLVDFYLQYNDEHHLHDITVYSVYHPGVEHHPALQSTANHYRFIKADTFWAKVMKRFYKWSHREGYYFYTIEYFIDRVMHQLRKEDYDLILIENRPGYALKLAGKTRAKLVYHLHNAKLDTTVKDYQQIYDAASRIITVSDFVTAGIRTVNPDDQKCVTVYNGISHVAFNPNVQPKLKKADFGFDDDDFVMLYNGKINPEKGIMELVKAMKLLGDYPKIKLLAMGSTFYGGNSYNDHPYAHRLLNEAEPVMHRIKFTSFVPYQQMPDYVKLADVAIIPSVWDEPFGLTVAEAQSMGKPIITTRRGGIPEVVSEENALLLTTDEHFVEHLAEAILDLYQHPEKRERMAAASRSRSHLFSQEDFVRNFYAALDDIP